MLAHCKNVTHFSPFHSIYIYILWQRINLWHVANTLFCKCENKEHNSPCLRGIIVSATFTLWHDIHVRLTEKAPFANERWDQFSDLQRRKNDQYSIIENKSRFAEIFKWIRNLPPSFSNIHLFVNCYYHYIEKKGG